MADYVLTIDQGTTGSRAMVLDAEAKERGREDSRDGWIHVKLEEVETT